MGLAALALLISVTGQARGQSLFTKKDVLTSNGGEAGDQFGYSVDLDGHVAVIGARRERTGTGSGTVYVHRFNGSTWPMETGLVASDGRGSDWFGCSVAVSGNVVVVGADHNDEMGLNSGAVYVYRRIDCSWVEEQIIRANDSMPSSFFGSSVSVSGDVMVIGAYGSDYTGDLSGAVDVYRHDGIQWVPEQRLVPNDNTGGDRLGISVSVSGDVIIAGASTDDHRDIDAGSAYVFRFDGTTWVEEQKLVASNPFRYSQFGRSVSVSGDVALIGAPDHDWPLDSGRAYLFRYDGNRWFEEQRFIANDRRAQERFGRSVSIDENVALIGLPSGSNQGVYVYTRGESGWLAQPVLESGATEDNFGFSVAVDGGFALAGAIAADSPAGTETGSVHAFSTDTGERPCEWGTVNASESLVTDVLRANGFAGHCRSVDVHAPIEITMNAAPAGPTPGRFVLYAWSGEPDATTDSVQPENLGTTCFPTFLSVGIPKPDRVWNNLGHPNYLGTPDFPSDPAPTIVAASPTGFRRPIRITLQGYLQDFGSSANVPLSVTNAVTLHIK